ncbi:MAG: restriction endonuclease subunit S [Roseivirga sp.]
MTQASGHIDFSLEPSTDSSKGGWKLVKMGDLLRIKHGFAFKSEYFGDSGDYIVMTPGHFHEEGGFRKREKVEKYYTSDEFPEEYILREGDLVLAMTEQAAGLLGSTVRIPESKKFLHNQRLGLVQDIATDRILKEYVYLAFNNLVARRQIDVTAAGTKVKHTSPNKLYEVEFLLPPLPEQKAIAAVLSKWDEGIAKLTELIELKAQKQKGLMQQLLTGKKRFAGFEKEKGFKETKIGMVPKDWEVIKAKDIFKSISIKNNQGEELLAVTQDRGAIPRSMLEGRVMSPAGSTMGYKLVVPGNFIISLRSFQGGLEFSEYRGLVSPAYTILEEKIPLDKTFFRYFFKSPEFISRLAVAVIGIRDGKQVSFEDFGFLSFRFPPLAEQQKIASVLNAAEQELKVLRKKLESMKAQKKGLMQQLLTGKVRVKTGKL